MSDTLRRNAQLSEMDLIKHDRGSLLTRYCVEFMSAFPMAEKQEIIEPEQLHFGDDGVYPGSALPVLLYRAAITVDAQDRASVFERGFAQNDWRNSWRNGVYSFAHYHSTSHEVLGVYDG